MKSDHRSGKNIPPKTYTDQLSFEGGDITLQPIGYTDSPFKERFAAPRQPALRTDVPGIIRLNKGLNFDKALADLDRFSHIWVIYWMHLNQGWNPTVIPPRGPRTRRGLFSTRAPHRPNSLGLSAVRLVKIKGLEIHIQGHDLLDGTPVLDIKPYIPFADCIEDASNGWLEEMDLDTQTKK